MIMEVEKLIDILNLVKIYCDDSLILGMGFIRNVCVFYYLYFW